MIARKLRDPEAQHGCIEMHSSYVRTLRTTL